MLDTQTGNGAVRAALREATSAPHHRLHRSERLRPFLEGRAELESYRELLSLYYGFFEPLERGLLAYSEGVPWLRRRAPRDYRTRLLHDDMLALGIPSRRIVAGPTHAHDIRTLARFAGALYVVEGSMMGGPVLFDRVAHLFEPGRIAGRRYFLGHGDRSRSRWRASLALIEEIGTTESHDDIAEQAVELFVAFERWISQDLLVETR